MSASPSELPAAGIFADAARLAAEIESFLFERFLDCWFPRCVDPKGGFHQAFARDWTLGDDTERGIVFQSRMVWTAAAVLRAYPEQKQYADYVRHGLQFLTAALWDRTHGGFFWTVCPDGQPADDVSALKRTYGQAFGLYALSAAAKALGDQEVAAWAQQAFEWIDSHAYDTEHGGWFELLAPDGSRMPAGYSDSFGHGFGPIATYGLKLQNTHLHVMEALIETHAALEEPLVETRLCEAAEVMLERMFVEPGCLHTTFRPDWTPLPAAWSIGHDIEASHLLRAANAIVNVAGLEAACAALVRHCLDHGFDWERGGIYEVADAVGPIWDRSKGWWNQCEALAGFAAETQRAGGADTRAARALYMTWVWIRDGHFDPEFGGVFAKVGETGERLGDGAKGHAWKAAYHETRAMLLAIDALKGVP